MIIILLSLIVFAATAFAVRLSLAAGVLERLDSISDTLAKRLQHAQSSARLPKLGMLWCACVGSVGLGLGLLSGSLLGGMLGMALGAGLPWAWASLLETRKLGKFGAQLAGNLDLFCGALRSGQSLNQALATLASEAPEPGREYFSGVSQKVTLGATPEAALDELAGALKGAACGEELRMLSTAVSVTRATGGNLAEITSQLSDTLRERERLRAEIESMTAQGKLSGWIVGSLPVLILVALNFLDPGLVAPMFHSALGLGLLGLSVILELLGAFFISRIVSIDT